MKNQFRKIYQFLNILDVIIAWYRLNYFSFGQKILNKDNARAIINPHGARVCHVIAAGQTATDGIDRIQKNDLVFGTSISPLAYKNLTHYFCEAYSDDKPNLADIAEIYGELLPNLRAQGTVILHKSLWQRYNRRKIYRQIANVEDINIHEHFLRFYTTRRRNYLIDKKLKSGTLFQCSASNIILLQIAFYSGCDTIVFHGVDGGGRYFIEKKPINNELVLSNKAMNKVERNFISKGLHITRKSSVHDQFEILKILSNRLKISVFVSSQNSPLSSIFPTYEI